MKLRRVYPGIPWIIWALAVPMTLVVLAVVAFAMTDAGTVPLDNPHLWWLLSLVPLAGVVFLVGIALKRRTLQSLTSPNLAGLLTERLQPARQAGRAALLVSAIALVAMAIIGPRWGMYVEKMRIHGVDIVVAIDVSRSMLANDLEPTRLERAKREIRQQLVERPVFQGRHRLALMAFAGNTSIKVPLTTDLSAFRTKLEAIGVGSAPKGGTAVGNAVRNAIDLFARSPQEASKILLVVTDGEDHEGDAVSAAREAFEEHNIRVYGIGVGDPSRSAGVQIPAADSPGAKPMLYNGQIVFSKVNVDGLRMIAAAGGGQYAPIEDLHALVTAIAGMKSTELTTEERMRHKPQYQWFLVAALICLGLEATIRERSPGVSGVPARLWQVEPA